MPTPSIKGSAIVAAVADVNRLVEAGRISREELEVRLEAEDLELLDEKIQVSGWYPVASYGRIADLLAELEAGTEGREAYLMGRGRATADRLFEAGLYSQLERVKERVDNLDDAHVFDPYQVRLTLSLWGAMVNFTRWHFEPNPGDPESFTCEVFDAAAFPEALRLSNAGFLEGVFSRLANALVEVRCQSTGPDTFVYRARVVSAPR
jgi:hypothetical protein